MQSFGVLQFVVHTVTTGLQNIKYHELKFTAKSIRLVHAYVLLAIWRTDWQGPLKCRAGHTVDGIAYVTVKLNACHIFYANDFSEYHNCNLINCFVLNHFDRNEIM
jgi:hypothetical protein